MFKSQCLLTLIEDLTLVKPWIIVRSKEQCGHVVSGCSSCFIKSLGLDQHRCFFPDFLSLSCLRAPDFEATQLPKWSRIHRLWAPWSHSCHHILNPDSKLHTHLLILHHHESSSSSKYTCLNHIKSIFSPRITCSSPKQRDNDFFSWDSFKIKAKMVVNSNRPCASSSLKDFAGKKHVIYMLLKSGGIAQPSQGVAEMVRCHPP